jgi:4'-phosphopantetheinyl transferase
VTDDAGEIRVFWFDIELQPERIAELEALLSPAERARADRFHFARDRARFIGARGTLRRILARFVQAPADALTFEYGPFGKPALSTGCPEEAIRFNLSRSGGAAAVAVARKAEVGLDLEQIRPFADDLAISERMFAPAEHAALLALPTADRVPAFFDIWTRREAIAKAIGQGLSLPLRGVVLGFGARDVVERVSLEEGRAAVWVLSLGGLCEGHAAALACTSPPGVVRCERWTESSA